MIIKLIKLKKRRLVLRPFCTLPSFNKIKKHYQELEKNDYLRTENYYLDYHATFLNDDQIKTEEFMHEIFVAKFEFVWNEIKKKNDFIYFYLGVFFC